MSSTNPRNAGRKACPDAIKPSEQCKASGLKSLDELSKITKVSTATLRNWSRNRPELFDVVLRGAAAIKVYGEVK